MTRNEKIEYVKGELTKLSGFCEKNKLKGCMTVVMTSEDGDNLNTMALSYSNEKTLEAWRHDKALRKQSADFSKLIEEKVDGLIEIGAMTDPDIFGGEKLLDDMQNLMYEMESKLENPKAENPKTEDNEQQDSKS